MNPIQVEELRRKAAAANARHWIMGLIVAHPQGLLTP